jgi:hypothetical protein
MYTCSGQSQSRRFGGAASFWRQPDLSDRAGTGGRPYGGLWAAGGVAFTRTKGALYIAQSVSSLSML